MVEIKSIQHLNSFMNQYAKLDSRGQEMLRQSIHIWELWGYQEWIHVAGILLADVENLTKSLRPLIGSSITKSQFRWDRLESLYLGMMFQLEYLERMEHEDEPDLGSDRGLE
ncbi:hypothetical protein JAAARDRAFT_200891 [Jaapia argillacea MUCL 33604]|uniref:Uncharacterized protein n=1 Tax=Jaapia argillacea MUCL 33604 TaxID=933084 RepID=A0A067P6G4_9AGAM|nr:hypothetical protein JAAARDRAFT_200891 [Jaapia argillacea MUCL 33604]